MEGREMPFKNKYNSITNDWNYDTDCTLTSLVFCTEKFVSA
jgi:hypothetical protein